MTDIIYSNSWEAARSLDVKRSGSNLLIDSVADQLANADNLFRRGVLEKGSFSSGFAYIFNDTYAIVGDEVRNLGGVTQAVAGATLGIAKVFGSMPFALTDYAGKVVRESHKGLSRMAAAMIIEGGKGIVLGAANIVTNIGGLIKGELSDGNVFDISFKVSEVAAGSAVMITGTAYAIKGLWTVADSLSFGIGGSAEGGALTLVPELAIAGAGAFASGIGICGRGISLMSLVDGIDRKGASAPPKKDWTDDELADVLQEVGGNRVKAAEKTGIERHKVTRRIDQSADGSKLSKWKDIKGRSKRVITEDELFKALEESGGSRKIAAGKLEIERHELKGLIDAVGPKSKVAKYKTIKGQRGRASKAVTEDEVAAALEKTDGRCQPAEKILGIERHRIRKIVENSGPESKLAKFKGPAKGQRLRRPLERDVVNALVEADGDVNLAARILGKDPEVITQMIKDSRPYSDLARFKGEWDGFTQAERNPDFSPPDDGFYTRYIDRAPQKMTAKDVENLGWPEEF